jgi:hypothetical protein
MIIFVYIFRLFVGSIHHFWLIRQKISSSLNLTNNFSIWNLSEQNTSLKKIRTEKSSKLTGRKPVFQPLWKSGKKLPYFFKMEKNKFSQGCRLLVRLTNSKLKIFSILKKKIKNTKFSFERLDLIIFSEIKTKQNLKNKTNEIDLYWRGTKLGSGERGFTKQETRCTIGWIVFWFFSNSLNP